MWVFVCCSSSLEAHHVCQQCLLQLQRPLWPLCCSDHRLNDWLSCVMKSSFTQTCQDLYLHCCTIVSCRMFWQAAPRPNLRLNSFCRRGAKDFSFPIDLLRVSVVFLLQFPSFSFVSVATSSNSCLLFNVSTVSFPPFYFLIDFPSFCFLFCPFLHNLIRSSLTVPTFFRPSFLSLFLSLFLHS